MKKLIMTILFVFLLASFASAALKPNAILVYEFQDGTDIIDETPNSLNGTKINSPTYTNPGYNMSSEVDCSNTNTNAVISPDLDSYMGITDDFTLEFWADLGDSMTNVGHGIIVINNAAASEAILTWEVDGTTTARFGRAAVAGPTGLDMDNAVGGVHHYIMAYETATNLQRVYIDGVNVLNSTTMTNDPANEAITLKVNMLLENRCGPLTTSNFQRVALWNESKTHDEIIELYNSGSILRYADWDPVAPNVPVDSLSFVSQVPADITTATPFQYEFINITYAYFNTSNLTQPYLLNKSVVSFSPCIDYVNGSCQLLNNTWVTFSPNGTVNSSNQTSNVSFILDENDVFPHNENFELFDEPFIYGTQNVTLTSGGQADWFAEYFQNFTTGTNQNYTMIVELSLNTSGLVNVYMANSSFLDGANPSVDANVFEICSILSTDQTNHTHTYNNTDYGHYLCRVNVFNGSMDGVKVTNNMSVLIRGTAGTTQILAIDDLVRANSARFSANSGNTWSDSTNSFTHIHFYSANDFVEYQAFSNRTDNVPLNSSVRIDTFDVDPSFPISPIISFPKDDENVESLVNITYASAGTGVYYTITLLNSDTSFNKTLTTNNSDNLNFEWQVYNESDTYLGQYFVRVQALNSLGTADDIEPFNITRNARVNVTAKRALDDAAINTFSGWVYHIETGTNDSYSTTSGFAGVSTLRGNVSVYIDADNFSLNNSVMGLNVSGENNATFLLYQTNTINITFYDEANPEVILSGPNITLDIISDIFSANYSTTNGTLYLTLLQPTTYTMRYSTAGFTERFYTFTLSNRTYNLLNLYLINNSVSENISVFVIDEIINPVQGALVYASKYNLDTNSYVLQEIGTTDVEGKTIMTLTKNDEFYRFQVYVDGTLKFTSTPAYITTDEYTIQINFEEEIAEDIFDYWGIQGTLSFNTATNNFRLDYVDSSGISSEFCVRIDRDRNTSRTYNYNESCSVSAAGSILVGVVPENGTTYHAFAYYTEGGAEKVLDSKSYKYPDATAGLGTSGLIAQAVLTLFIALIALQSMALAFLLVPFSLILGSMVGLHELSMTVLVILQVIGLMVAYVLSKKG